MTCLPERFITALEQARVPVNEFSNCGAHAAVAGTGELFWWRGLEEAAGGRQCCDAWQARSWDD